MTLFCNLFIERPSYILMVYFMLYVLLVLVAIWVTCLLEHLHSQTILS